MAKWFRRRSRRSRVVGAAVGVAAGVVVAFGLDVVKDAAMPVDAAGWLTVVALAMGAVAGYGIDRWVGGWADGRFGAGRVVLDTNEDLLQHFEPRSRGVMNAAQLGHRFQGRQVALLEISDWLVADDVPPLLVVTGDPGSGKSAVLGRVVITSDPGRRRGLPRGDRSVLAPLRSVGCEVHAKGSTVEDVAAEIGVDLGAAGRVSAAGLAPLLRKRLEGRRRRFVVVLDALDEAVDPRALIREVVRPLLDAAPLGVRVVVGTRRKDDRGRLSAALAGKRVEIDLDLDRYFAVEDLAAYALACLRVREDGPYRGNAHAKALAEEIARRSGRSFLVAGLVATNHGLNDTRPTQPSDLTGGATLSEVLDEFLDRLPPVEGVPARNLLVPLAHAHAPGLPVDLWQDLVPALTGTPVMPGALTAFAHSASANLLVTTAGSRRVSTGGGNEPVYRLFHQALNDTILDQRAEHGLTERDQQAMAVTLRAAIPASGWKDAPAYLSRSLGDHLVTTGQMAEIVELLDSTDYLLHTDLPRLHAALGGMDSALVRDYRRLIGTTPDATSLEPAGRAATFTVTATYTSNSQVRDLVARVTGDLDLPYRGLWAHGQQDDRQTQTLTGHTDAVTAVAVTGDGRRVVSGSWDGTVRIWDLGTGVEQAVLIDPNGGPVHALSVTPDGRTAVIGSGNDTVRVWDLGASVEQAVLTGHTDAVISVVITPDGCRALTGSRDGTARVWDLSTGAVRAVLAGHNGPVHAVVTPDGRRAVTGDWEGTVRVWDLGTGEEQAVLTGNGDPVTSLAITPDGCRFLIGSRDGAVGVWDLDTGVEQAVLSGPIGPVHALAATPDGRNAVAGFGSNTVRVWDLDTGVEQAFLTGHIGPVTSVAITPDGRRALTGSWDRTVRVWDPSAEQGILTGHTHWVLAVAITPDGRRALTGSRDRTVRVWDLGTGTEQAVFAGHIGPVTSVAVTPDGRRALTGSWDQSLRVWDLATGAEEAILAGHTDWVTSVAVTPDGRHAVTSSKDRTVRVWDLGTGAERAVLTGHKASVTSVAVTSGGRYAISGSDDWTVRVWDLGTGTEKAVLTGYTDRGCAVAVTPDGRRALIGSYDGAVRVWDLSTGSTKTVLKGHTSWVCAVAVTPDGRHAVTGSLDGTVRVWDLDTAMVLQVITLAAPVNGVAISGTTVIAALSHGAVALELNWDYVSPSGI